MKSIFKCFGILENLTFDVSYVCDTLCVKELVYEMGVMIAGKNFREAL